MGYSDFANLTYAATKGYAALPVCFGLSPFRGKKPFCLTEWAEAVIIRPFAAHCIPSVFSGKKRRFIGLQTVLWWVRVTKPRLFIGLVARRLLENELRPPKSSDLDRRVRWRLGGGEAICRAKKFASVWKRTITKYSTSRPFRLFKL